MARPDYQSRAGTSRLLLQGMVIGRVASLQKEIGHMLKHHKALASAIVVTLSSGVAGAAAMIGTGAAPAPASVIVSLASDGHTTTTQASASLRSVPAQRIQSYEDITVNC